MTKTILACNRNLSFWVVSLWATHLDSPSCLNKTLSLAYPNCRNYVWLCCLKSAPPLILKPFRESDKISLDFSPYFSFTFIISIALVKSKRIALLCHARHYIAQNWVQFFACLVCNDNLFSHIWHCILFKHCILLSADIFSVSTCPHFSHILVINIVFHFSFFYNKAGTI